MQNINQLIKKNFFLSNHSVERLMERFKDDIGNYNIKLLGWKPKESVRDFYGFFRFILSNCTENRALNNNTAKMIPYYEKFGFDCEFVWMENAYYNMILLFKKEKAEKDKFTLITVLPTNYRVKYARNTIQIKEKKEVRKTKQLLQDYTQLQKQYGERVFADVKDELFLSKEEKLKKQEGIYDSLLQSKKETSKMIDYKKMLEMGFLDIELEMHKKIAQLVNGYDHAQQYENRFMVKKFSKTKKIWHLTIDNQQYTVFANKTGQFGMLFNIMSDNSRLSTVEINHWFKEQQLPDTHGFEVHEA